MAGAEMLEQEAKRLEDLGGGLYFYHTKEKVFDSLRDSEVFDHIGDYHFFPTKKGAIHWVFSQLNESQCQRCDKRIFMECKTIEFIDKDVN